MKSGKATGPGDIAFELWKANSWDATLWPSEFFNRVIEEGRTPSDWQQNTTYGKISPPTQFSNYYPVAVPYHEDIPDNRVREFVEITVNQYVGLD